MCEGDENANLIISSTKKYGTSPNVKKSTTPVNHGTVGPQKAFKKSVAVQVSSIESLSELHLFIIVCFLSSGTHWNNLWSYLTPQLLTTFVV